MVTRRDAGPRTCRFVVLAAARREILGLQLGGRVCCIKSAIAVRGYFREGSDPPRMANGPTMKRMIPALVSVLVLLGCARESLQQKVVRFGEASFCETVLRYPDTGRLEKALLDEFAPLRTEEHLGGVLLVYSDDGRYTEGLYVDRESLAGLDGSGLSIAPWGKRFGWLREKTRVAAVRREPAGACSGFRLGELHQLDGKSVVIEGRWNALSKDSGQLLCGTEPRTIDAIGADQGAVPAHGEMVRVSATLHWRGMAPEEKAASGQRLAQGIAVKQGVPDGYFINWADVHWAPVQPARAD